MGPVAEGRTNTQGIPRDILELALLYELSESYVVGLPLLLQKGIFGALARTARWMGYDPEFSRNTKPDGAASGQTPPHRGQAREPWPRRWRC